MVSRKCSYFLRLNHLTSFNIANDNERNLEMLTIPATINMLTLNMRHSLGSDYSQLQGEPEMCTPPLAIIRKIWSL